MRRTDLLRALAISAALAPLSARAQLKFGSGGAGGDGTWNANPANTNWNDGANDVAWNNGAAVFEGVAGTVLVDTSSGAVSATGLTFSTSDYIISGGPLSLTAAPAIAVTSLADVATISANLSGITPSISGAGTIELSGNNTFAGTMTFNSGTLRLGSTGALNSTTPITLAFGASSTGTLQLNGNSVTVNGLTTNATVGSPVVENNSGSNAVLTVNNSSAQTFAGLLQDGAAGGTLGLTKTGSGTFTRNSAGTYTGVTTVSAGVLVASNATALGAASGNTVVQSGAALQVNGAITIAEPITLNGTGISNAGALRKTANNATAISGAITLASASRINSDSNTLTLSGGVTGAGQDLTVGGAGNTTISGVLGTTTGTLNKDGAGILTLSANNSGFVGAINVTGGGKLSINGTNTTGTTTGTGVGVVTLDNGTIRNTNTGNAGTFIAVSRNIVLGPGGGTLEWSWGGAATDLIIIQNTGPGTIISGVGGLTKTGTGVIALGMAATYQGPTRVSAGTFRCRNVNDVFPTTTALTVDAGAVFDLDIRSQQVGSLDGGGSVKLSGSTGSGQTLTVGNLNTSTTFSGQFTEGSITGGKVTKVGTGTLTLSGDNLHTGLTLISAGAIAVESNTALGTTAGTTTVSNNAALHLTGSGLSIAEPLSITGAGISTTGAVRNVSGSNMLTGAITLAGAARINSDAGSLSITGNVGGTTQTLTVGGAGNTTIGGTIATTTGGLTKDGAGTLVLGGVNTYTGATTVNGGTLRISAAERIADTSAVTLAGGTFDANSLSETAGALTVGAGASTIDFGSGLTSVVRFATSATATWNATGVLNVVNWSGVPDIGGGTEQLFVGVDATGLTSGQLAQIHFVDTQAPGGFYPATILSTGEVVAAVPEPTVLGVIAMPALGLLLRRRRTVHL